MTDTVEPSRTTGRRRLLVLLASVSALVLIAAGLVVTRLFGLWGEDSQPEAQPSPSPTGTRSPFAGTPAENFAEGAAGIELPPAEPVGEFTADQVEDALEQVRDALIAARLDEAMLVEHDADNFLTALAPDHRPGREAQFESGEFGPYATQVAEDTALLPVPPRVDGEVSYDAATAELDLPLIEIVTRFVWVYAFESAAAPGSDLVVIRDELTWRVRGEPWNEPSHGLWLHDEASIAWGADCAEYEQGAVRPDSDPAAVLMESADTIFDYVQPLDEADGC